MKAIDITVLAVNIKQLRKVIFENIFNQFMKAKSFYVHTANTKQHGEATLKHI